MPFGKYDFGTSTDSPTFAEREVALSSYMIAVVSDNSVNSVLNAVCVVKQLGYFRTSFPYTKRKLFRPFNYLISMLTLIMQGTCMCQASYEISNVTTQQGAL